MKYSVLILILMVSACAFDSSPIVDDVAEREQAITLGCSQSNLRRAAMETIVDIFWGYRSECREIRLGFGLTGFECGQPEAYIYDRELGHDRAIDRFYTRVIPLGPTRSDVIALQFDQCGDGRAGDPGQGARTPLDSECWQAGKVVCQCGRPCRIGWYQ